MSCGGRTHFRGGFVSAVHQTVRGVAHHTAEWLEFPYIIHSISYNKAVMDFHQARSFQLLRRKLWHKVSRSRCSNHANKSCFFCPHYPLHVFTSDVVSLLPLPDSTCCYCVTMPSLLLWWSRIIKKKLKNYGILFRLIVGVIRAKNFSL